MSGHNLFGPAGFLLWHFHFPLRICSFLFEGRVLYGLLEMHGVNVSAYIFAAMIAHFAGLLTCGLFVRSQSAAKV